MWQDPGTQVTEQSWMPAASLTLVSKTPTKGLGLWAREQMALGQVGLC